LSIAAGVVPLAEEAEVHREVLGRLQHAPDVPRTRRAGRGERAVRRAGAAADHGGDARHQRIVDLLRGDEMDVRVDAAGRHDLAFAGDGLGAGADDDGDAGLDVGVAGLADADDAAVGDADVGLHDAPVVEDQGVGDHGVDGALGPRALALAHAVADHLAAAELHLLAVDGMVTLDLDDQVGVGQPHLVADGGAEHAGVGGARDAGRAVAAGPGERRRRQTAAGPGVEAEHRALAGQHHQRDLARLAGLEAHGGAGGDVEAEALGAVAVELQRRVGLIEMVVAADLDRAVAGVGDAERHGLALLVERDLALARDDLAGFHAGLRWVRSGRATPVAHLGTPASCRHRCAPRHEPARSRRSQ
jgi:hypothetical protein